MIVCESNGNSSVDHFPSVRKMINIGSNTKREVQDYKLAYISTNYLKKHI